MYITPSLNNTIDISTEVMRFATMEKFYNSNIVVHLESEMRNSSFV